MSNVTIAEIRDASFEAAAELLERFFREEGFTVKGPGIARSLRAILDDPHHWAALALENERPIGVVTMSTVLYVEW